MQTNKTVNMGGGTLGQAKVQVPYVFFLRPGKPHLAACCVLGTLCTLCTMADEQIDRYRFVKNAALLVTNPLGFLPA